MAGVACTGAPMGVSPAATHTHTHGPSPLGCLSRSRLCSTLNKAGWRSPGPQHTEVTPRNGLLRWASTPEGVGSAASPGCARDRLVPPQHHSPQYLLQLQGLLTLVAEFFASFDHSTCTLSVPGPYCFLMMDTHHTSNCSTKQHYSGIQPANWVGPRHTLRARTGHYPSVAAHSRAPPGARWSTQLPAGPRPTGPIP